MILCSCKSDIAPSRRAKAIQNLLQNVVPDIISKPSDLVWDILQELVYEGRLEPYAKAWTKLEIAIRQKRNKINDQTKEGVFTVEKASSSSRGPIQHIFSQMLVKAPDNGLNTLCFCILTCRTTWFNILVKV